METIILTLDNGEKKEYVKGIKLREIVESLKKDYPYGIICGKFNNQIINYEDSILKSGKLSLYDINTKEGNKIYERGLIFLFRYVDASSSVPTSGNTNLICPEFFNSLSILFMIGCN